MYCNICNIRIVYIYIYIFNNICIVIISLLVCVVINSEISLNFLVKSFF